MAFIFVLIRGCPLSHALTCLMGRVCPELCANQRDSEALSAPSGEGRLVGSRQSGPCLPWCWLPCPAWGHALALCKQGYL